MVVLVIWGLFLLQLGAGADPTTDADCRDLIPSFKDDLVIDRNFTYRETIKLTYRYALYSTGTPTPPKTRLAETFISYKNKPEMRNLIGDAIVNNRTRTLYLFNDGNEEDGDSFVSYAVGRETGNSSSANGTVVTSFSCNTGRLPMAGSQQLDPITYSNYQLTGSNGTKFDTYSTIQLEVLPRELSISTQPDKDCFEYNYNGNLNKERVSDDVVTLNITQVMIKKTAGASQVTPKSIGLVNVKTMNLTYVSLNVIQSVDPFLTRNLVIWYEGDHVTLGTAHITSQDGSDGYVKNCTGSFVRVLANDTTKVESLLLETKATSDPDTYDQHLVEIRINSGYSIRCTGVLIAILGFILMAY